MNQKRIRALAESAGLPRSAYTRGPSFGLFVPPGSKMVSATSMRQHNNYGGSECRTKPEGALAPGLASQWSRNFAE